MGETARGGHGCVQEGPAAREWVSSTRCASGAIGRIAGHRTTLLRQVAAVGRFEILKHFSHLVQRRDVVAVDDDTTREPCTRPRAPRALHLSRREQLRLEIRELGRDTREIDLSFVGRGGRLRA